MISPWLTAAILLAPVVSGIDHVPIAVNDLGRWLALREGR